MHGRNYTGDVGPSHVGVLAGDVFSWTDLAGRVRLIDPDTATVGGDSGRLEVHVDGRWGTVCDDGFTAVDARVVCQQLGLAGGVTGDTTGPPDSPILMDNVACIGTEVTLLDCPHVDGTRHNCGHSEDVWVACTAPFPPECALVQHTFMRPLNNIEGQPRTTTGTRNGCRERCNGVTACAWWTWYGDGGCHVSNSSSVPIEDATGQYGGVSSGPRCASVQPDMLPSEPTWTVCHNLEGGSQSVSSKTPSTTATTPPAQTPSLAFTWPPTVAAPFSTVPSLGLNPSPSVASAPSSSNSGAGATASDESTALDPSVLIGIVVGGSLVVLCGAALAWRSQSSQHRQPADHTTVASDLIANPAFLDLARLGFTKSDADAVAEPAEPASIQPDSTYSQPDSTRQRYQKGDHQEGHYAQPVAMNPSYATAGSNGQDANVAVYEEIEPSEFEALYAEVAEPQSDSNC